MCFFCIGVCGRKLPFLPLCLMQQSESAVELAFSVPKAVGWVGGDAVLAWRKWPRAWQEWTSTPLM